MPDGAHLEQLAKKRRLAAPPSVGGKAFGAPAF